MGAQASAPVAPVVRASQAPSDRVLRVKGAGSGAQYCSTTALQEAREQHALPPLGDWWETPAARNVEAALNEAAGELPQPARGHALDLLGFAEEVPGRAASAHVRARRAYADTPETAAEDFDQLWQAPAEWTEEDDTSEPSAIVLQHHFPRLAKNALDMSGFAITLRTLISGDLLPGTRMDNLHVLYEAVKEFGAIG